MFYDICTVADASRLGVEKRIPRYQSVVSPPPIYNVFEDRKEFVNDLTLHQGNHRLPERPLTPNLGANRPTTRFKSRAKSSSEVVRQIETTRKFSVFTSVNCTATGTLTQYKSSVNG